MKAKTRQIQLTARDVDVFKTLTHGPRTIQQLLRHSCRFQQPCDNYEALRQRLAKLVDVGILTNFRYYVPAAAMANYYKLSRSTYRLLYPDNHLPGHSYFDAVKFANQNHTYALSEFISLFDRDAFDVGYKLANYRRDQDIKLELGEQILYPDAFFQLQGNGQVLNYFLELDCGTEPIISHKNRESLTRKIRFYDDYSKQASDPFRVLFVFTEGPLRRSNFIDAAYEYMTPPYDRTLFLATMLPDSGSTLNLVTDTVFLNHKRTAVALGLNSVQNSTKKARETLVLSAYPNKTQVIRR